VVRAVSVIAVLAVIALSAVVQAPVVPRSPLVRPPVPAVALTALTQPLVTPTPLVLPMPHQDPLTQQINFHIAFVGNFLATGAALFAREFAIPGALLEDLHRGTPIPDALGRAVVDFAQVELDAGRELVRFAVQYVSFQVGFVANIVHNVVTFVMAIPIAVGDFLGSFARPAPVTEPSAPTPALSVSADRSRQAPATDATEPSTSPITRATPSSNDDARKGGPSTATAPATTRASTTPKRPKEVVAAEDSMATAGANPREEAMTVASENGRIVRSSAVDRAPNAHRTAAQGPHRKHDGTDGARGHEDEPTPGKQGNSVR
jgi:hypothetical protein